jgi:tRNA threonylcarbamoyladenosine biosynthesis protein TsaB
MKKSNTGLGDLKAISVSNGPGSYTGLRIGLSTAKGLCYALQIPLITINTLKMMADASSNLPVDLLCPMIDARRMEVYTAVYNKQLDELTPVHNRILDGESFSDILQMNKVAFIGNGSAKFMSLISHKNAVFYSQSYNAKHLVALAFKAFQKAEYADLAYVEPCYGKAFYSPPAKSKM